MLAMTRLFITLAQTTDQSICQVYVHTLEDSCFSMLMCILLVRTFVKKVDSFLPKSQTVFLMGFYESMESLKWHKDIVIVV